MSGAPEIAKDSRPLFDVRGKHVLVTGGTRGLGRAISLELARSGAIVHAGYFRNEQAAKELAEVAKTEGILIHVVKGNLMTSGGISAYRDQISTAGGRLDVLVYNSATGVHKPLAELTQRHLSAVWQVNVGAFFDLSLSLLPMLENGGKIIAISSEGASHAVDQYGAVGSSKGALESLSRQMAVEWIAHGIRVNVVAPGMLQTETLQAIPDGEARAMAEAAASPLKRLVDVVEVAYVVRFLCSDASAGIVGQTIVVDGGKRISAVRR